MTPAQAQTSSPAFLTALIIDDHPLFCDALSMTLKAALGMSSVQTVSNLEQAFSWLSTNDVPDVIVLDLNLPDVQGLDGLVRLRNRARAPIVVVSSMAENKVISATIRAGAAGFVPKHSQRDVFKQAFDAVSRGETFIPPGHMLVEEDDETASNDVVARLASLTNQQGRILQLICEGKLNKQIAYDLSIAETTVKAHVTAIMRKLGVQSRTQAVLIALGIDWVRRDRRASGAA